MENELKTMEAVVTALTARGFERVTLEYPGVVEVLYRDLRFVFGTANGSWACDVYERDDQDFPNVLWFETCSCDTEVPGDSTDVDAISNGIAEVLWRTGRR